MPFTLRQPTLEDAPALADLHISSWKETYSHLLPEGYFDEEHINGRHQLWQRILKDSQADFSLSMAEIDDHVIGFAFTGPTQAPHGHIVPRDRQLYSIYVAKDYHGSGAGQALLNATLGDDPALLWVAKANDRAIRFYQRNGFSFDGTQQINRHTPKLVEVRMIR